MEKLVDCTACGGFVEAASRVCPHCGVARTVGKTSRSAIAAVVGLAAGSAFAMTLMACYGLPPCDDGHPNCYDRNYNTQDGSTDGGSDSGTDASGDTAVVVDAAVPMDGG